MDTNTIRRSLAALAAIAVVFIGAVVMAIPASAETQQKITGGTLTWGVKESFRNYLLVMPISSGKIEPVAPAVENPTSAASTVKKEHGVMDMPVTAGGTWNAANPGIVPTTGGVHFLGHPDGKGAYILDFQLVNPQVVIKGASATITAEVSGYQFESIFKIGPFKDYGRIDVANFATVTKTEKDNTATYTLSGATLTEAAVPAFNNYDAGAELDDATLTVKYEDVAVTPTEPDPSTPTTEPTKPSEPSTPTTEPSTPTTPSIGQPFSATSWVDWGFKESFRKYIVNQFAKGTQTLSEGAAGLPSNTDGQFTDMQQAYRFPLASKNIDLDNLSELAFTGKLNFNAHGGVMNVTLSNPQITLRDGKWILSATSTESNGDAAEVALAELGEPNIVKSIDSGDAAITWSKVVALQGTTDVFGKNYAAGTQLDPVSVYLASAVLSQPDPQVPPTVSVSENNVTAGATVTLIASGFTPGETVRFTVHSDPIDAGSVVADNNGDASVAFAIPAGFAAGTHTVVATGETSGTVAQTTFTVQAPASPTQPGSTTQPDQGTPLNVEAPSGNTTRKVVTPTRQIDTSKKCLTSGTMTWGVKESFTTYIRGKIAKGGWTLGGGSTWNGSAFTFPTSSGTYNTRSASGTFSFGGSVHFTGHEGVLDVILSNPSLVVNGSSAALYVNATTSSATTGQKTDMGRVHFANVALSGVSVKGTQLNAKSNSVTLTDTGAKAFAGFYKTGQALDNLSVSTGVENCEYVDPATGQIIDRSATLGNTGALQVGLLMLVAVLATLTGVVLLFRHSSRHKSQC
ncbi:MAG: HtaA domain-containing protein [Varibaculum sp.]|nr:HtaA domain-containing protein [Varibaculum sp.]